MKTKKAFTLVELSVVIAVSGIVCAMLSLALVQAQSLVFAKRAQAERQEEVVSFKNAFSAALENFQTPEFALASSLDKRKLALEKFGENPNIFKFENSALWLNQQQLAHFVHLESAEFQAQNSLVQCTLTFDENYSQTLVFTKRI